MALLQLTMIPMGAGVSVSEYVLEIKKRLEAEKAVFCLQDMGTVIEGDITYLLKLLGKIYETPFEQGAVRVVTNIMIDDRRDKKIHLGDKISSVAERLSST